MELGKDPVAYSGIPKTKALLRAIQHAHKRGLSKLLTVEGWSDLANKYNKSLKAIEAGNARSFYPTPDNVLNTEAAGAANKVRKGIADPADEYLYTVHRRKTPITSAERAQLYNQLPLGAGVTIGSNHEEFGVAGLKNILGMRHNSNQPMLCSGGVCNVMKGMPGIPDISSAPLPKDLTNLPGYEVVARSAMPAGTDKKILRSGLRMAGMRSIPAMLYAGAAGGTGLMAMRASGERGRELERMRSDVVARLRNEAKNRRWFMQ
jgi:hypothetical protein